MSLKLTKTLMLILIPIRIPTPILIPIVMKDQPPPDPADLLHHLLPAKANWQELK